MRAINAILVASGSLKLRMTEHEDIILVRALFDVNIPKFTNNDIPLFKDITSDLFPGVILPEFKWLDMEESLKLWCDTQKMICVPNFLTKCIQLWETIGVRHSLMVVGMTTSGKSTVIEALRHTLTALATDENE